MKQKVDMQKKGRNLLHLKQHRVHFKHQTQITTTPSLEKGSMYTHIHSTKLSYWCQVASGKKQTVNWEKEETEYTH